MTDVFISYARVDKPLAEALAKDLVAKGYAVWWDAELVSSDNFQDMIYAVLSNAKAAIVIWTRSSAKSNFVRDEARYALHYNKLIATKIADLPIIEIPFGFQSQHTDDISARESIIRAIDKLGVKPTVSPSTSWENVQDTNSLPGVLAWIGANPTHRSLAEAVSLAQKLAQNPPAAAAAAHSEPIVRRSRFSAFFSGLAFRVPTFQLSSQAAWTSIGFSVAAWAVFSVFILIAIAFDGSGWSILPRPTTFRDGMDTWWHFSYAASALLLTIAFFFSHKRLSLFLKQKAFTAAAIMAPLFVTIGIIWVYTVLDYIGSRLRFLESEPEIPLGPAAIIFYYLASLAGLIGYTLRQFYRHR